MPRSAGRHERDIPVAELSRTRPSCAHSGTPAATRDPAGTCLWLSVQIMTSSSGTPLSQMSYPTL